MGIRLEICDHTVEKLVENNLISIEDFRCLDVASKRLIQQIFLSTTRSKIIHAKCGDYAPKLNKKIC